MPVIASMLMPTRGRAELALRSAKQLLATAKDPAQFELLLACDEDDRDQADRLMTGLRELGLAFTMCLTPPLGYGQLHRYNNMLASQANGRWLCIWNDDLLMQTLHWDEELAKHVDQFVLIDPEISNANAAQFRYGLFPIVPRDWFRVLGHLSASAHNDTYMVLLAETLNIKWPGLLTVYHDRFDETGHNNDATYQAREYQTENFYNNQHLLAQMNLDARRLGRAIRRTPGMLMRLNLRDDSTRPSQRSVAIRSAA